MKLFAIVLNLLVATADGFITQYTGSARLLWNGRLIVKSSPSNEDSMKRILQEEALNKDNMAATAKQLKNMKPEDMDNMIAELDNMNGMQASALKALGMDPEMIKKSMKMMRDNPAMMKSMGSMMETMTPEEMMAKSREAQKKIAGFAPELVEEASKTIDTSQMESAKELFAESDEEKEKIEADPIVLDKMFAVAELMSQPPTGGVTFSAFASLPPITLLSGDRDVDLSKKELKECWADGSLGASRLDRIGFERVWNEVQEFFEGDIMEEARKTSTSTTTEGPAVAPNAPAVGASLSAEQMEVVNERVKEMSDDDMTQMLEAMSDVTPEQEARMKAMGVDPAMMQKTAQMMKSNPMMRKAASAFMKNLSPEQMRQMSQQTQSKMAGMTKEDYDKALENFNKETQ
mmetsp:Transcript_5089/g.7782  ORF Transcript_5089/g.7782 Transcript_5089/m.7782 type:complete len:404 (-) Transcript_5089:193-1404(-)|eukprot:CAMPEP_0178913288 /NCGR_PEP_ID=MMETSP0786-20121207/10756_1 /TAXON_ID=186022 /ORGANISM="Thalassionema frauenfeldii, Strain CCMP 1798" /LENGTH=403 /DNA_ID=CAMNT_0020586007 /DNA_START=99 /DNA_END=1310 /DNA_ORIENTATION=-